jgi:hypothetical protein
MNETIIEATEFDRDKKDITKFNRKESSNFCPINPVGSKMRATIDAKKNRRALYFI